MKAATEGTMQWMGHHGRYSAEGVPWSRPPHGPPRGPCGDHGTPSVALCLLLRPQLRLELRPDLHDSMRP
eukprot:7014597-Alexandrium_andersonii.AAC.1